MRRAPGRSGRRFRLLLYNRLYAAVVWPSILLLLALAVLWWYAPFILLVAPFDQLILYAAGLCALLLLATALARPLSYVQCRPDHLRIQTPILRLAVSYQRVHTVRPVKFGDQYPSEKQRWSQRRFLEPLFGMTGVAVSVRSYPISLAWLKVWLNDYMFTRDAPGFLFLVNDWMTLSREIDVFRDRWRERQAPATHSGAYSMSPFLDR
jgi:hypothetical protein